MSLPSHLTPLVGRDGALGEIQRQILQPDLRILTLVGPGGIGKTRLAIQAASELAGAFEEVVFVDFTPLTDSTLALRLLANSLGVIEDGAAPLIVRLARAIGDRQLLLVLDNLERILPFGSELSMLLRSCSGVKALATSRASLRVSGEQEFSVPPLDLPDAIALFVARAQAVRPSILLTAESEPVLMAVCHELDMLPLAIELAAARTKVLSVEAILTRLEHRLSLLTGGPQDSPERQRSLRDAIAWSYDLLDEADRRRFRGLAVFVGGFTLDAFEHVVEDNADSASDALDTISSLVDKNLVRVLDQPDRMLAFERFDVLGTVRDYAFEQLLANQEQDEIAGRHAAYYVDFIERAAPEIARSDAAEWMGRIENELPNLRAALAWLIERNQPDGALRLAIAPWLYWVMSGRLVEGRSWLDKALLNAGDSSVLRARAVGVDGFLASTQGDYAYQTRVEDEGLIPARQLGDELGEAIALFALGDLAGEQNDFDRANELLQEAITMANRLNDNTRATIALLDLGSISRRFGFEERGEAMLAESVRRARAQGFGLLKILGLNLLNRISRARGDTEQAREMYRESLELAWELRHRLALAYILLDGAALAVEGGEPERGARLLGAAEALREAIGLPREPSAAIATGAGYDSTLIQIKAALSAPSFAAAWDVGRSMTIEQAVEEAMWDASVAARNVPDSASTRFGLTARELDVLRLLVAGHTDRQIGEALFISPRTAQVHVANILAKLNVPTRGAAAASALRLGLISEPPPDELTDATSTTVPLRT